MLDIKFARKKATETCLNCSQENNTLFKETKIIYRSHLLFLALITEEPECERVIITTFQTAFLNLSDFQT